MDAEEKVFIFRIMKDLTQENVKYLVFLLGQRHAPWTESVNSDVSSIFEQMKQRMVWIFDRESKKCNFTRLAEYMKLIQREDLEEKLRNLGKANLLF